MSNKEMIIEVLKTYSCLNSVEIKGFIHKWYDIDITPQSVAGSLRTLVTAGYAGKYPSPSGKMVYWLTDYGKEQLLK